MCSKQTFLTVQEFLNAFKTMLKCVQEKIKLLWIFLFLRNHPFLRIVHKFQILILFFTIKNVYGSIHEYWFTTNIFWVLSKILVNNKEDSFINLQNSTCFQYLNNLSKHSNNREKHFMDFFFEGIFFRQLYW